MLTSERFYFRIVLASCLFLTLPSCKNEVERRWEPLAKNSEENYNIFVRYYEDDAKVLPFHLGIAQNRSASHVTTFLRTNQCENVIVFNTQSDLVIFYDSLDVGGFIGDEVGRNMPRPLLCDNYNPICSDYKSSLLREGIKGASVCQEKD